MHRHRQSSACASPLSRRGGLERLSPPPPHTSSPPPRPPLTSSIPPLHVPPPPPRPPCLSSPNQLACSSSSGAGVRRLVRPRIPVERREGSVHLGRHSACVALRITSGTAQGRPRSAPYRTGSPSRPCSFPRARRRCRAWRLRRLGRWLWPGQSSCRERNREQRTAAMERRTLPKPSSRDSSSSQHGMCRSSSAPGPWAGQRGTVKVRVRAI